MPMPMPSAPARPPDSAMAMWSPAASDEHDAPSLHADTSASSDSRRSAATPASSAALHPLSRPHPDAALEPKPDLAPTRSSDPPALAPSPSPSPSPSHSPSLAHDAPAKPESSVRRHSRRASSLFRNFSKRLSISPAVSPFRKKGDDLPAPSEAAESDSAAAAGTPSPAAEPPPPPPPPEPVVPPQPYFMVRPRNSPHSSIKEGKAPIAAPSSPATSVGGRDTPTTSADEWPIAPGLPPRLPSLSTRELAASKGRLSLAAINTSVGGLRATSSEASLPATPTGRASAWSAPPSIFGSNTASRPVSTLSASASSAAMYDNTHLRLGEDLALMSHGKTLELYRANARRATDPQTVYELAVFMVEAAQVRDDVTIDPKERKALFHECFGMLRKIADRGHVGAQYYLAECMAAGVGRDEPKGKALGLSVGIGHSNSNGNSNGNGNGNGNGKAAGSSMSRAHAQYVLAAKHGHADAAYKAGRCYEKGWGCMKDNAKAIMWLRKAGAQGHPGALYRLGTAELNGELGRRANAKEGIKYLKLSAQVASREWPQALHELALVHDRGISGVVFPDHDHACELLARAAELGYAPSAYKLGYNYEYGKMGCSVDGGLSVHMYNIAAQQGHRDACFALTAWYLVGVPGVLPQSDTEAYLWAERAARAGLAKAEYAMGYFCENGIGTPRDPASARTWYTQAVEHGDKRGGPRLNGLRSAPAPARRTAVA